MFTILKFRNIDRSTFRRSKFRPLLHITFKNFQRFHGDNLIFLSKTVFSKVNEKSKKKFKKNSSRKKIFNCSFIGELLLLAMCQ